MSCCCHHKDEETPRQHSCGCGQSHSEEHSACGCGSHEPKGACSCNSSGKSGCCCSQKKRGFLSSGARVIIALVALVLSFCVAREWIGWRGFPLTDPAWLAVILCGLPIMASARNSFVYERKITAPFLISAAMLAAISLQIIYILNPGLQGGHSHQSYIFAAGEIAFLMALGAMIEELTIKKSRSGIEKILALSPKKALLKDADTISEIEAAQIKAGDILIVKPFSAIPADGVVLKGATSVNQANLTGESAPVEKREGDEVLAGTLNAESQIEIRATKDAAQTALSKMIALVKEAEGKRAPIARIADKWASYLVPAAILISIIVGFFAFFILEKSAVEAATRGVTILVVFCPCALVLATPTAIAAGIGCAARLGILIKSASALETLGKCKIFAFDKTGTLTRGKIKVSKITAFSGFEECDVIRLAAAAEAASTHPFAAAVLNFAKLNSVEIPAAENKKMLPGFGAECELGGEKIYVGKAEKGFDFDAESASFAVVKAGDKYAGAIEFSDEIKSGAAEAVSEISRSAKCVMLTGDGGKAARKAAAEAGIAEFYAELLPAQKLEKIRELRGAEKICMVGDGANDAPSLACADCSIAMGALGSDAAIESAQITVMNDNLKSVSAIFALSKRAIATIKINISISMLINFAAVLLAAFGILNPVSGAIWHNMASVLVVLNSARLLGFRKN